MAGTNFPANFPGTNFPSNFRPGTNFRRTNFRQLHLNNQRRFGPAVGRWLCLLPQVIPDGRLGDPEATGDGPIGFAFLAKNLKSHDFLLGEICHRQKFRFAKAEHQSDGCHRGGPIRGPPPKLVD